MDKKPTLKKIAQIANVSVGTVDRVLHNRGDVSKKTIQLVKKIMEDLSYVPNTFARNLALNKNFKIAVLLPEHEKGEYWSAPLSGTKKASKEFKMLGVVINTYLYDQRDSKSFMQAGQRIFDDKNEAVLLSKVLSDETHSFLEKCKKHNIPFVLIGSGQHNSGAICHIGQNSNQGGRLAGELLSIGQRDKSKYLVLNITKAQNPNSNVKERIAGFKSYFEQNNKYKSLVEVFDIPQEDGELVQKIQDKLRKNENISGIFVPNSKSFILAKALQSKRKIRIVGYDLLDKNKKLLEKKQIDFLINQRPYEQAYQGIEFLYRFLSMGQVPPQLVSLPLDIVTKEKLTYY